MTTQDLLKELEQRLNDNLTSISNAASTDAYDSDEAHILIVRMERAKADLDLILSYIDSKQSISYYKTLSATKLAAQLKD